MTGLDDGGICVSVFHTPVIAYTISTVVVDSPTPESESPVTSTTWDANEIANATTLTFGTKYMEPLLLYWQETDLPDFDKDYASVLAQRWNIDFQPTTATEITVTATTASPTSRITAVTPTSFAASEPDPPATPTSRLSSGAKAGIGIAATVGIILLTVAGCLLYKKRRRQKTKLDKETIAQNEEDELVQAKAPKATT
jgi:hypothetical protein